MASSSSRFIFEVMMKHDEFMVDLAHAHPLIGLSPFKTAANHLSDVSACLKVVADLNLLATGKDFPLRSTSDAGIEFKFLKRGDSFRASVRQVSNTILQALFQIDTCMSEIFTETSAIPELMSVFEQMKRDSSGAWDLVPVNLEKMAAIGANCAGKADVVVDRMSEVRSALSDLLVDTLFVMGQVEEGRKQAVSQARIKEEEKTKRIQNSKQDDAMVAMLKKNGEDGDQTFTQALDKSGLAAELAKQMLLGMCDPKSAVKKLLDPKMPKTERQTHFSSDVYVAKLLKELQMKTISLRMSQFEGEKAKDRLLENTKVLFKTLSGLSAFTAREVDLKMACFIIEKRLAALDAEKATWANLPSFFRRFVGHTMTSLGQPSNLRTFQPANLAAQLAFFINAMAHIYCQMSQKHFMPLANQLGSFIVLNPEEDAGQIERKKRELKEVSETTLEDIKEFVVEMKREEDVKVQDRLDEMKRVYKDYTLIVLGQEKEAEMEERIEDALVFY